MNLKIEHLYIACAASELLSVVSNSGLFIYFVFDLLFHLTLSFPVKLYSFLPFLFILNTISCCGFQLQVPDEALSVVMSIGFGEQDAKRALRMSNQDVQSAVNFLVVEREKREQKREDDIRRRNEIKKAS